MVSRVASLSGTVDRRSPAVKMIWSTVPVFENKDLILSSTDGEERSQGWPVRRSFADG